MKKVMKVFSVMAVSTCLIVACNEAAKNSPNEEVSAPPTLDDIKQTIEAGLQSGKPGITVESVKESAIDGMYKASIGPGQHLYITADGKYFINGDIYEVKPGNIVNLTEAEKNPERVDALATIEEKDMITFAPEGETKKVMYVFTDVDCGYCQLLHSKMPEYNELGIEVRYLAYPRAGINSNSYNKIASAWCADDPNDALTKLKQREEIPDNVCENNPVDKQYNVGRQIGLTGTPAIILEDGQLIAGYVEPARIKGMIGL